MEKQVTPAVRLAIENALLARETAAARLETANAKLETELTKAAVAAGVDLAENWSYDPAKGAFLPVAAQPQEPPKAEAVQSFHKEGE